MPQEKPLIPVFIPPLAIMLAAAERKSGAPLTQAEAEGIRDRCACVMMKPDDARKMDESRGYVDVNPDNCWADWHRLRPQMVGGYLPKIVLCIPGNDEFRRKCAPILQAAKLEHEFQPHDPRMPEAFRASSMTRPCLAPDDFARLAAHTTVLYVLSESIVPATATEKAAAFVKLGRQLIEAGGIAIKCESSGLAHSAARWQKFAERVERGTPDRWAALFDAYVLHPISADSELYTCGMHLLGQADLILSNPAPEKADGGGNIAAAASELFRSLGTYLVAECPVGRFAAGHTFSMDAQSPRYRASWEPCEGYAEDDLYFNPFGRWRLKVT